MQKKKEPAIKIKFPFGKFIPTKQIPRESITKPKTKVKMEPIFENLAFLHLNT
jgi:hypothetical protein